MSKYYLVHGELHSDDELYHWKYIKRERIGGRWVYTYPDKGGSFLSNVGSKLANALNKREASKPGNEISRKTDDAKYKAQKLANKAEYEAKKLANKGERDMNRYKLGLDNGKLSLNKTIDPKNEAKYLAKNVSAGAKFVAKTAANIALSELNKIGSGKADNKIKKAVNKGKKIVKNLPEEIGKIVYKDEIQAMNDLEKALNKVQYDQYVKNVEKRNAETAKKKEEHMKKLAEAKEKEKKEKEAQDRVDEMLRKRRHGIWY